MTTLEGEDAETRPQGLYERFVKDRLYTKPGYSTVGFDKRESQDLRISGAAFPATRAIQNGGIDNASIGLDNLDTPTVALGMYVPGTGRHLSVQTLLGSAATADIEAGDGVLKGDINPVTYTFGVGYGF